MIIAGNKIAPGEEKQLNVRIARLPTRMTIEVPIIISRSIHDGPTLLLMGGLHGDEINGIEIMRRIITNGYSKPQAGTVICIPIVNIHGFINFSRLLPDGKDINRSFPGNKSGSLASQIAYHLRTEIIPKVDYIIDFHTGGARINNYPQIRTQTDIAANLELARAFSPRFIINSKLRSNSFRKEANKNNKPIILFEGGESLRLRKHAIDHALYGTLRVMKYLNMRDAAPPPKDETILIGSSTWIRAKNAGLYYALVRSGDQVSKGQQLGFINGPFGDFEMPIKSTKSGHILSVNNNPVINRGDALFHLGISG